MYQLCIYVFDNDTCITYFVQWMCWKKVQKTWRCGTILDVSEEGKRLFIETLPHLKTYIQTVTYMQNRSAYRNLSFQSVLSALSWWTFALTQNLAEFLSNFRIPFFCIVRKDKGDWRGGKSVTELSWIFFSALPAATAQARMVRKLTTPKN